MNNNKDQMVTSLTVRIEQLEGDGQKMSIKFDPPLTPERMVTDPTAVTANRLMTYIQEGMNKEYSYEEIASQLNNSQPNT